MKIVSRYISRVMLTSFLSVLGIFVGLLFIHRLFKIIELAIKQSLGIFETLPLFLWAFPPVLLYSIPISALSAVLVTFGKMAGDNETTAALAAGISRKQLAATPIYFALILSVFAFVNNVFLVPSSYVYFDNIGFGVGIDPIKALKPGRISRMKSRMLSIETIQPEDHRFTKLFAILPSRDIGGEEKGGGRVLLLAERGTWHMSQYAVSLNLENGSIQNLHPMGELVQRTIEFEKLNLNIPLPRDRSLDPKRQGIITLIKNAADPEIQSKEPVIEISRRVGHAMIIPFFILCALPLVLRSKGAVRGSSARGTSLYAIGLYFLFWMLTFVTEMLVDSYAITAFVLTIPYLIFSALTVYLWKSKP